MEGIKEEIRNEAQRRKKIKNTSHNVKETQLTNKITVRGSGPSDKQTNRRTRKKSRRNRGRVRG